MRGDEGGGRCPSQRWRCGSLVGAALAVAVAMAQAQPPAPVVAAASDLSTALPEIAAQFTRETGDRVQFVFGSSGTLARQVRDGAPFELYLSADETYVADLARAGLTRDGGVLYAIGRLVLFAPTGSPLVPSRGVDDLRRLLTERRLTRFAMANPTHAPYGRAAEAVLRTRGLWAQLQPSIVLGENVSQAAQFAVTGNAVGGLIAYSLALAPGLRDRGTFALVPDTDHPALRQRMVRLARAGPVAERFYRYLQGPHARAVFERSGFALPR